MTVAAIAGATAAAACPDHLQFLELNCPKWQTRVLPESIPASKSNLYADNEGAAAFGMRVFYDNRFSQRSSGVACANCHDPEHAFAERKATSHTISEVARNAPDLLNAAWYVNSHFWDGRIDNLWSAPLFTFEQDAEMGSTRLDVAHVVASIYRIRYEKIFGPLPDLSDARRFPPSGKPGTPEFDAMSGTDKEIVNTVYVNVGKALEAYMRMVAAGRAPFDDFLSGAAQSLSADAQRGMQAFTRHGCDTCHSGPTFTDEGFHKLGFPEKPGRSKDMARAGGLNFASTWEFSRASKYADSQAVKLPAESASATIEPEGFRTPTLRNVALTAPYGHDGTFETLEQMIDAHAQILPDRVAVDLKDRHDIVEFLRSLSGRPPRPPWNYWPGG